MHLDNGPASPPAPAARSRRHSAALLPEADLMRQAMLLAATHGYDTIAGHYCDLIREALNIAPADWDRLVHALGGRPHVTRGFIELMDRIRRENIAGQRLGPRRLPHAGE